MRLRYAYADLLLKAGRRDDAIEWFTGPRGSTATRSPMRRSASRSSGRRTPELGDDRAGSLDTSRDTPAPAPTDPCEARRSPGWARRACAMGKTSKRPSLGPTCRLRGRIPPRRRRALPSGDPSHAAGLGAPRPDADDHGSSSSPTGWTARSGDQDRRTSAAGRPGTRRARGRAAPRFYRGGDGTATRLEVEILSGRLFARAEGRRPERAEAGVTGRALNSAAVEEGMRRGVRASSGRRQPLQQAYDLAMLDLDDLIYVGRAAVPASKASGRQPRAGISLAFVTNNASRPPRVVAEHLTELGVEAAPEESSRGTGGRPGAHRRLRTAPRFRDRRRRTARGT